MNKEVLVNKRIFSFLIDSKVRKLFLQGGAGSGKSYAIAQHLILNKLFKEKHIGILVIRKALPSLKSSCYSLIRKLLDDYGLPYQINKSDLEIRVGTNKMFFKSLDDPEKIKSIEGINYIWIEEATELNERSFLQLDLRAREKNTNGLNQLFLSFNPIDTNNYLHEMVRVPKPDCAINYSTYKDNAFLPKEYIQELEGLQNQDKTFYTIYTLGQWATPVNIIYTNYDVINKLPDTFDIVIYGLDFGFNNQSALIKIGIKDNVPYIDEKLYESKLTNEDLLKKLEVLINNKSDYIFADNAEPARIEEIRRSGFNIHQSDKSVKDGIDYVKRNRMKILDTSVNVLEEIRNYKWKEDKNGKVLDDEPVAFQDHAMSCIRYALYTWGLKHISMPNIRFI